MQPHCGQQNSKGGKREATDGDCTTYPCHRLSAGILPAACGARNAKTNY
jgi:hypothetical protein